MIKLIVTDMDGTLLNDKHEIHPDFWEIEETLANKGILLAVASGRQYYNLESNFSKVKDRMIFFAENGTLIMHKGKELYVNPMKNEAAKMFIEEGRKLKDVEIVLCGKNSGYIETKDEKFINEISNYYERLQYVDDLTKVEDTILKVTICDWRGVEENCYQSFKSFEKEFKVAIAADIFLDITTLNANKGNAIINVQEKLNISPEETLVFGDYLNDLEMMQNAKYSYAMKNAHSEIIKTSRYVTEFDNNENGVLITIKELGLMEPSGTKKTKI
jgi:Cof subfamily protein (haloacid dehalogenase superfamily)